MSVQSMNPDQQLKLAKEIFQPTIDDFNARAAECARRGIEPRLLQQIIFGYCAATILGYTHLTNMNYSETRAELIQILDAMIQSEQVQRKIQ